MGTKFQVYDDAAQHARWRLVKADGRTTAARSGVSYITHAGARRAAESFKARAYANNYAIYRDDLGNYRWRATSTVVQEVALSGACFASRAEAQTDIDAVRALAAAASGP